MAALRRVLLDGHLGGAAIDVVPQSPLSLDDGLWRTTRLLVTPHVAAYHAEHRAAVERFCEQQFELLLKQKPLRDVVDLRAVVQEAESDVAVIIPLFNGEKWIGQTLRSITGQTYPPREIIVVDDGSHDGGVELVRRFRDVKLLRNPEKGVQTARNFGLQQSESRLVAFVDQDDVWHPLHLEHLVGILESRPSAGAIAASAVEFEKDGELEFPTALSGEVDTLDLWERFPFGFLSCPAMVLIRRSAIMEAGGWNPKAKGMSDWELWLRISAVNEFLYSKAITVGRRIHGESYGHVLRADKVASYVKVQRDRAADLAKWRAGHCPGETDSLMRRVRVADCVCEIVGKVDEQDRGQLIAAVSRLETLLEEEPDAFRDVTLGSLLWFLCPRDMPRRRLPILVHLHDNWPGNDRLPRRILEPSIQAWTGWYVLRKFRSAFHNAVRALRRRMSP